MTDAPGPTRRQAGLDTMRALAIVLVVVSHGYTLFLHRVARPWLGVDFVGGFGVGLFFALSGFLVGRILLADFQDPASKGRTIWRFWSRRWLRTLPLYYLFLALNWFFLVPHSLGTRFPAEYLVFGQGLRGGPRLFFGESWSLAVEEVFYIAGPLLALLLSLGRRASARAALLAAAWTLVITATCMRVVAGLRDGGYAVDASQATLFRLDAIAYGVLFAAIAPHRLAGLRRVRSHAGVLALLMFTAGSVLLEATRLADDAFPDYDGPVLALAWNTVLLLWTWSAAAALLWFLDAPAAPGQLLLTHVSRVSYSWYLVHLFVGIPLAERIATSDLATQVAACVAWIALTLGLATLSYWVVERPILAWRDRHVAG